MPPIIINSMYCSTKTTKISSRLETDSSQSCLRCLISSPQPTPSSLCRKSSVEIARWSFRTRKISTGHAARIALSGVALSGGAVARLILKRLGVSSPSMWPRTRILKRKAAKKLRKRNKRKSILKHDATAANKRAIPSRTVSVTLTSRPLAPATLSWTKPVC